VAFLREGNIWSWTADEPQAVPLTHDGDAGDIKLSTDGAIVAFMRSDASLWAVNTDGAGERQLVSAGDFAAMQPTDPGVTLHRFEWVPGTHILAYSTRLRTQVASPLSGDLRLVDADTLERTVLLPPGEGGEFTYSPDGRQIAIVTPGSIDVMDANDDAGDSRQRVFDYEPLVTDDGFQYYARPVWASDSGSLRAALPPADLGAQPSGLTSLWHIFVDGRAAKLQGSIPVMPNSQPVFSPDLTHVAYLVGDGRLLVLDVDSGETVPYHSQADDIYGWAPDSQRFAFSVQPDPEPQAYIAQLGVDGVPAHSDAAAASLDLSWVDAYHYLYAAPSPQGWSILLGEYGGFSTIVASGIIGPPAFALARPVSPVSMAALPRVPTPTPQPAATPTPGPVAAPPLELALQPYSVPDGWIRGLSADGRYVLLESMSVDLIEEGQPAEPDIPRVFLYDREADTAVLVSATAAGLPADWWSAGAALSADGSTVAFWSFARNLAGGQDAEDCPDAGPGDPCGSLYIYDVPSGTLERIPVGAGYGLGMANATALSADGRNVAFATNGGAIWGGTMLLDRETGVISQISTTGLAVDISADGRYAAFVSDESNLTHSDSQARDVFVFDRETDIIERISTPLDGGASEQDSGVASFTEGVSAGLDISPDGRYVVFVSGASNLVEATFVPCALPPGRELPACRHVYLHDRETGVTELISLSVDGTPGDGVSSGGSVSPDGRWVAFTSAAGNLTPAGPSTCQAYSMGGNCPEVYVRDRQTGQTYLLSMGWDGQLPNGASFSRAMTSDGRYVVLESYADNLVPDAGEGLFIADLLVLAGQE
jgi:Tol biopolymer transport system component